MKILLEQEGGHLVMYIAHEPNQFELSWDATVTDMAAELDGRRGVRRMSYDTWHWDLRKRQEAEEYITYFYLKHG
jgi:hypothetical protein